MKKLSIVAIAALFTILAVHSTKQAKADVELTITNNCDCQHTPSPTPTASPRPTQTPNPTTQPTEAPTQGLTPAGAPICTDPMPDNPVVTAIVRKGSTATITWTKSANANHYLIFYGTFQGSRQYGVPDTGNTNTYTISFLDPNTKYYFEVHGVNGCQPNSGQVLGASTSVLAATDSDLIIPRAVVAIITAGVSFAVVKKHII